MSDVCHCTAYVPVLLQDQISANFACCRVVELVVLVIVSTSAVSRAGELECALRHSLCQDRVFLEHYL